MSDPLTLGTAGHIDHGKTALVRALTGTDTDRLPEERARGISIALGYARLELPSGRALSVVDVPGHERFVRTMVAGATGIDLYLMTVAADDGVMPQTREHAAVLAALGVTRGVVAVTKADLADPARAAGAARDLVPEASAFVPVSARTGEGLDALRAALDALAGGAPGRDGAGGVLRLHVDRSFTIRGAGTVVTGTLWSGAVARGDTLVLQPAGRAVRVRSVQVHDAATARADAGQRVALNLAGVALRDVRRGDALVAEGAPVAPTLILDCALELHGGRPGARVQVHHGTRDVAGRLVGLGEGLWQLRLEQPLLAAAGDRLVVRSVAPPDTLGGGTVLDARAPGATAAGRRSRHGCSASRGGSPSRRRSWRSPRSRRRRGGSPLAPLRRWAPGRSRSRGGCWTPGTSRRRSESWAMAPPSSRRCAPPAWPCASAVTATRTPTRWRRSPDGSRRSSRPRERSRSPGCATSWAPRAPTRRRCSSTSTRRA
jgi:selenocysteine-specific elongation factor SelB